MAAPLNTCPCDVDRNPVFVLQTPKQQVAANTVYQHKKVYDAAQAAAGSNKVYNFKTDRERMQYKIGKFGLNSQGLA